MAFMPIRGGEVPGGGAAIPGSAGNGLGVYNTGYLTQQAQTLAPAPVGDTSPPVFMGNSRVPNRPFGGGGGAIEEFPSVPQQSTANQLMLEFEGMSADEKRKLARKLAMAGMLSRHADETLEEAVKRATLGDLEQAYGTLLMDTAGRNAQGQLVSPDDVLEMHIRYNLSAVGGKEDAKENSWWDTLNGATEKALGRTAVEEDLSGTHKSVSIQRDIYSAQEARSLARMTLRNALDRDPTEEEYEDFVAALQTEQRENPVRTVTRTTTDEDGQIVRTNSTSHGGVDVQQFAFEEAQDNPGYAEWQAIGTYLPVALNALGSGVAGA